MAKYTDKMREMITENTRREIQRAGIDLIREGGWSFFTTERIAERIGVSRGMIYNYFENKEAIAHEIIKESFDEVCAKLQKIVEEETTASERMMEMGKLSVADFCRQRELHRVFMENLPPPGKRKRQGEGGHLRRDRLFEQVVAEGIASGEFMDVDAAHATLLLVGGLHEICMHSVFLDKNIDVANVVNIFLRGIRK